MKLKPLCENFNEFLNFIVSNLIIFVTFILKQENLSKGNGMSSEAGFLSLSKMNQFGFSMQFIIILIIFVAFDLEILFLSGIVLNFDYMMIFIFIFFCFINFNISMNFGEISMNYLTLMSSSLKILKCSLIFLFLS